MKFENKKRIDFALEKASLVLGAGWPCRGKG
jgi:hypothetical protein